MHINEDYYFQKGEKSDFSLSLPYTSTQYFFFSILLLKQTLLEKIFFWMKWSHWSQQLDF